MHALAILRGCGLAWACAVLLVWMVDGAARLDALAAIATWGAIPGLALTTAALLGGFAAAMCGARVPAVVAPTGGAAIALAVSMAGGASLPLAALVLGSVAAAGALAWIGAFGLRWRVRFGFVPDRSLDIPHQRSG